MGTWRADPDAPEFSAASLEEWKTLGTRICTLSPFTIPQNSLHGCFGASIETRWDLGY
jgi:hypothetical protein